MNRYRIKYGIMIAMVMLITVQDIMAKTVVEYFREGGKVMWALLFLSVLVLTFSIERLIMMFRQRRRLSVEEFIASMEKSLKNNSNNVKAMAEELIPMCDKRGGAVGSIMGNGLKKYLDCLNNNLDPVQTKQWLSEAVEERGRIEIPLLEARLSIIAMCANIAPLVGLLGTVIGMISAFETMSQSKGGAKPDELSGDISVALITTAGGLILAIPSLIIFNFLKGRAENYILDIEEASIQLIDTLLGKNK
ncbi:MAG: MotA/TolQ/ExbB proton channel family protein [bacterium]